MSSGPGREHLFTIGHSNHPAARFLELLREHRIEVLVDVRSAPYSRYSPQFNHEPLRALVTADGIRYVFRGQELGGRPDGPEFYDEQDRVDYRRLAAAPFFQRGIEQLRQAAGSRRVAVMCSEECPAVCHRHLLIARVLHDEGVEIRNIRGDGRVQSYEEARAEEPGYDASGQLGLFGELEEAEWKSIRSVSRGRAPESSSNP